MNKKKEQLEKTIKCPVCGVEKMFLSVHLKNAHGLSKEEAKSKFGLEHLFAHERMFNDCNMDISNEMMVQSDPCGDTGRLAEQEMTNPSFHGVNNEKM
jgi:transcription elongation factor Elf1